jgi:hypothetical protein
MGGPGQQKHGPTAYSGRAWVSISNNFGKAWPDKKWLTRAGPGLTFSGQAGPGPPFSVSGFVLARPGPKRCPGIVAGAVVKKMRNNFSLPGPLGLVNLGILEQTSSRQICSITEIILKFLNMNHPNATLTNNLTFMWCLWKSRNDCLFNQKQTHPKQIHHMANAITKSLEMVDVVQVPNSYRFQNEYSSKEKTSKQ